MKLKFIVPGDTIIVLKDTDTKATIGNEEIPIKAGDEFRVSSVSIQKNRHRSGYVRLNIVDGQILQAYHASIKKIEISSYMSRLREAQHFLRKIEENDAIYALNVSITLYTPTKNIYGSTHNMPSSYREVKLYGIHEEIHDFFANVRYNGYYREIYTTGHHMWDRQSLDFGKRFNQLVLKHHKIDLGENETITKYSAYSKTKLMNDVQKLNQTMNDALRVEKKKRGSNYRIGVSLSALEEWEITLKEKVVK